MVGTYAIIKHDGRIYRIPATPFESNESVYERGWIIAKQAPVAVKDMGRLLSEASMLVNEKRLGMKYESSGHVL